MLISVLGSSTVSVLSINDRIHYIYIVFAFRYLILPTMITPGSVYLVTFLHFYHIIGVCMCMRGM